MYGSKDQSDKPVSHSRAPRTHPARPPGGRPQAAQPHLLTPVSVRSTWPGTFWVLFAPLSSIFQAVLAEVCPDAAALLLPFFIT